MRVHTAADIQAILSVYEQSEDFLSLGPVPKASMKMVSADIEHSTRSGGVFCVIENHDGVPRCIWQRVVMEIFE